MAMTSKKRSTPLSIDRRGFLKMTAASAATFQLADSRIVTAQAISPSADRALIETLSAYIANGASASLPDEITEAAKHHILDTFAAIVSGSTLKPGQLALKHVQNQGGDPQAQLIASKSLTSAVNAAFANAMMAHSDETDDSHRRTLVHPGASIVPAALAMSEKLGADGTAFLKSVVVGYEVGCRMILALDPDQLLQGSGATPGIGGTFGATAACASLAKIDRSIIPFALSFAAQQASGINSWMRDQEHVEKAFVFAGMPARNGVTAVELVQSGFTGESNPFNGPDNFLKAFSARPDPTRLIDSLGSSYEIMQTDMKRFPVGFPIQAAVDAILKLIANGVKTQDVKHLTVRLPAPGVHTVDDRSMPDVNVQYIVAVTLIDGTLKFDTAHSPERMRDPKVLELKRHITLLEDTELTAQKRTREANLELIRTDGTMLQEHGICRGTIEYPMTRDDIEAKVRELVSPVLGRDHADQFIWQVWNLETTRDMRALRPFLRA